MRKLGIEPEASEGNVPAETLVEYAKQSLNDNAPTDETPAEKEPYFYSKESEEEAVESEVAT